MDEKCEGMCLSHLITSTFCKSLAISPTACGIKHSRRCQGRMKLLGAVLLGAVLLSSPAQLSKPEEQPQVCYFDVLSGRDSRFCRGELQVIYPDVGDVSCIYMPKCHQYRWRIIRDWMRPRVRFPQADEVGKLGAGRAGVGAILPLAKPKVCTFPCEEAVEQIPLQLQLASYSFIPCSSLHSACKRPVCHPAGSAFPGMLPRDDSEILTSFQRSQKARITTRGCFEAFSPSLQAVSSADCLGINFPAWLIVG
ncbi:phosphatidylethanolamine-binding protein 4 isoform X2 [Columba livia]|uniref:phosphatidylethanolamine-binding protein 4 isoform X2 n=1 Tax=Columba livia TaxID=8932 RepID=UPI0031B9F002